VNVRAGAAKELRETHVTDVALRERRAAHLKEVGYNAVICRSTGLQKRLQEELIHYKKEDETKR
jgi:uncharacterized NAD(P)/FAD-binding protein YdhS